MWASLVSQPGHIKWFIEDMVDGPSLKGTEWLVVAAIVAAGLLISVWLTGKLSGVYVKLGQRFEKRRVWLPFIVRVTAGSGLLLLSWKHHVLAPHIEPTSTWMFGLQIFVGLCWVLGIFERFALAALAALFVLIGLKTGVTNVLEQLGVVGAGAYLVLKGNGPLSLNMVFEEHKKVEGNTNYAAYRIYGVMAGVALVTLAFSEILLNTGLAGAFLAQHDWNFLSGLGASDRLFIIVIGSVKLLLGLLLILNRIPRIVALILLGVIVTTTIMLWGEAIYGHLLSIGLVAVLLIGELKASVHLPKGKVHQAK